MEFEVEGEQNSPFNDFGCSMENYDTNIKLSIAMLKNIIAESRITSIPPNSEIFRNSTILLTEIRRLGHEVMQNVQKERMRSKKQSSDLDIKYLKLQGILSEIMYLKTSIANLTSSNKIEDKIDSNEYSIFMSQASDELKTGMDDYDILRLNMKRFELHHRRELLNELNQLKQWNKRLEQNILELEVKLSFIAPRVNSVLESAKILLPILGCNTDYELYDLSLIKQLSKPLYSIYSVANSFAVRNNTIFNVKILENIVFETYLQLIFLSDDFTFLLNVVYSHQTHTVYSTESISFVPSITANICHTDILAYIFLDNDVNYQNEFISKLITPAAVFTPNMYNHQWLQLLCGVFPKLTQTDIQTQFDLKQISFQDVVSVIFSRIETRINVIRFIDSLSAAKLSLYTGSHKNNIRVLECHVSTDDASLFDEFTKHVTGVIFKHSHRNCYNKSTIIKLKLRYRSSGDYFDVNIVIPNAYPEIPSYFNFTLHSHSLKRATRHIVEKNLHRVLNYNCCYSNDSTFLLLHQLQTMIDCLLSVENQFYGESQTIFNYQVIQNFSHIHYKQ